MDVRGLTSFADYFLICHATSSVHLKTLVDSLVEGIEYSGAKPSGLEGTPESGWVLMDCGDLILHIFSEREREYYDLERLWGDAPRTELAEATPRAHKPALAPSSGRRGRSRGTGQQVGKLRRPAEGEKPGER
jgi:ribosome-associated protein